ncbi:MAG: YceH family protein [Bryobacteraceae bacterium]|nr:YceH family protein [Bryobacteraceae bacterium]
MDLDLDPIEIRVLAALVEKDMATPEYYPLTLNALVNACNQKSNREPVTSLAEQAVAGALERLRRRGLAFELSGPGHRVPKHGQRLTEALNLGRREAALLCELMLRGPQTPGELRSRAERLHGFSDLEEVESVLRKLAETAPPRVILLPREPGTREARWAHLLGH